MLMTEDEARTKVCPELSKVALLAIIAQALGGGELSIEGNMTTCSASDCPMWQEEMGLYHLGWDKFLEQGELYATTDDVQKRPTGRGYCGLAGRP